MCLHCRQVLEDTIYVYLPYLPSFDVQGSLDIISHRSRPYKNPRSHDSWMLAGSNVFSSLCRAQMSFLKYCKTKHPIGGGRLEKWLRE